SVYDGNFDAVQAALEAGANINGSLEQHAPPIVAATLPNHFFIATLLLELGAEPNRPVTVEVHWPVSSGASAVPGERALHVAARTGKIGIVNLLLKRSRAIPQCHHSCRLHPTQDDLHMRACLRGSGAVAARSGRRPGLGRPERVHPSARSGPSRQQHGLGRHVALQSTLCVEPLLCRRPHAALPGMQNKTREHGWSPSCLGQHKFPWLAPAPPWCQLLRSRGGEHSPPSRGERNDTRRKWSYRSRC
ncbi:unnamed protein product, partial [Laminaria digitata]